MTREKARTLLPVIQAWIEGKTIEFRIAPQAPWLIYDAPSCPGFTENWEWRIRPAPREFWIAFGKADGLVKFQLKKLLEARHHFGPNKDADAAIGYCLEIIKQDHLHDFGIPLQWSPTN